MLENTKVRCWGKNAYGVCDVPEDLGEVKQIAAGGIYSMTLVRSNCI